MPGKRDSCYGAIDLGGTKIAFALGAPGGELYGKTVCGSETARSPEAVLAHTAQVFLELEGRCGKRAQAVALGLPGLVDPATGESLFLPNLPGNWKNVPAGTLLRNHLSREVYLVNDARMATLGEQVFGRPQTPDLILLTLGTGIGGGIVLDGRLVLGRFGAAGEIGHHTVQADGPLCSCGNRGCLEAVAGGPAMVRAGIALMKEDSAPVLAALTAGDPALVTVRLMGEAAAQGDTAIRAAIERSGWLIGTGIANAVTITGIERVVLMGGLTGLGEPLLTSVRAAIKARVRMFPPAQVTVSISALGDDVAVLGGIAFAEQQHRKYQNFGAN